MRAFYNRRHGLGLKRWFGVVAAGGPGYPAGVPGPDIASVT